MSKHQEFESHGGYEKANFRLISASAVLWNALVVELNLKRVMDFIVKAISKVEGSNE